MALVSKIREKSGLIVFIVGLGLLLFIIPFDSIYSFFGGRGEQPIGEVYGREVYSSEWDVMSNFNQSSGYYSAVPNGDILKVQDERKFFQRQMLDTVLNTEIAKIGLQVSAAELKDYLILGDYPSPVVKNQFTYTDENEQEYFSKDSLLKTYNFFVNKLNSTTGDEKANWSNQWYYGIEQPARKQRLIAKYVSMAKFGVVGTVEEAYKQQISENAKITADVIVKEASTISDSSVTVTESEIKSYYEAHKEDQMWKISEDVAKIDFVLISVEPTEEDVATMVDKAGKLKAGFASAENDSAFIELKSDTKIGESYQIPGKLDVYPISEFNRFQTVFSEVDNDAIEAAQVGEVVGPFTYTFEGQTKVVLAKVHTIYNDTKVRHILVTDAGRADSIANLLKVDSSQFASLGAQFSEDPGFAQNGGYYDVTPNASLVPEFKSFGLENGPGTVGVVPTQFGFHVMQVISKTEKSYKYVAYIEKEIVPTEDTRNEIYESQGFGFMEAAEVDYDAALTKFGFESLSSTLFLAEPLDYNFGYNEELVNWLFAEGRTTNDVSIPIELKDGKFLVAKVNGIGTYGVPTYDLIKEDMKNQLLKEAKIEYIKKQVSGAGSIQEAEGILGGSGSDEYEITLDMNAVPGFTQDVTAIAKLFMVSNLNEMTTIEGKEAVYVVVVKDKTIAPVPADRAEAIVKVTLDRQNYVDRTINNALMKMADVRDWRMKAQVFYANQE